MKTCRLLLVMLCVLSFNAAHAQTLQPGFDKQEYTNLMKVSAQMGDSAYTSALPAPTGYRKIYRSPEMGLDNLWDLWMTDHDVPVISIRGTTTKQISWTANFYAAMVPAKGELQLPGNVKFPYQLSTNPAAAVHVGWLIGMAFLATDMMPKIDSLYKAGRKEMYIMGHSQGGGIAYLLTAYFYHLQQLRLLPADIRFKTYCSAGPKPGNLYFAHEYEARTQQGWAYNVVNSADWVPETLVSIQTVTDFNTVNPFVNVKGFIRKQSFIKRIGLNHAYNKLTRSNRKAANNYRKYLGDYVSKTVKKYLPGFVPPAYAVTSNYVRTGHIITLLADEEYYKAFPQSPGNIFVNHFHAPYLYLTNQLDMPSNSTSAGSPLDGTWELSFVAGANMDVKALFPNKIPYLKIDGNTKKVNGSTGCNNFNGTLMIHGNEFNFPASMAITRMMCPGNGEQLFLTFIKGVTAYQVKGNELSLLTDAAVTMRFLKK